LADRRRNIRHNEEILVIGLGRFGGNLALELTSLGHSVLGVDASDAAVAQLSPYLAKTVVADCTRRDALEQLGADQFNHVVVGVGDVEASILTVTELKTLNVKDIWAKAVTDTHHRILKALEVTHIVQPEQEMGRRIAHQVTGKMVDYIELEEGFALVESLVPESLHGATLAEAQVRARYDVTVVCIKPPGQPFTYVGPDTVLEKGAIVLVAGDTSSVEAFADSSEPTR
jgi:trk system potassium uptake protein